MSTPRDPAHYLKALKTTKTPKRLMWLDCAAGSGKESGVYMERWSVGCLGTTHFTTKTGRRKDDLSVFHDPAAMWQVADWFCTPGRRVVMFAYDLAYQLRISQALVHLPALGWRLDKIVLERTAAWALFRRDDRTLMMCDLKSWSPAEFETLADDVIRSAGQPFDYPDVHDEQSQRIMFRCQIVRDATLQILNWIEGENLGPFRPTGSGQSYSAYRRRFLGHRLLVHDDTGRLALERSAMWTGRCEAWRHGILESGPYIEYDMHAAYCHIAHECEIPTMAASAVENPSAGRVSQLGETYALLAEVEVTTEVPCVPTSVAGRTVWPVGKFSTVLWDPEIRLALEHAERVKFKRVWKYHRAAAMSEFAGMVLDGMGEQTHVYGLVPRRVMKHWSRCLVGRMGLRFRAWELFGTSEQQDLKLVTYVDMDAGVSTDMLIAGHDRFVLAGMAESSESMPQIPGWVMSECRARLWRAMENVGLDNVVYLDTDSIVVNAGTRPDVLLDVCLNGQPMWAMKGTYSRMSINGPRNLTVETTRRTSGVPLRATQVAPLEFSGQVMRSIKESMRAGELDCVASVPRNFVLDAPDLRREHLANNQTQPYRMVT